MVSIEIQRQVANRVKECLDIITEVYRKPMSECVRNEVKNGEFMMPTIKYFTTGTNGGHYAPSTYSLHFHAKLLPENLERYLTTTIPHEVAHLVNRVLLGRQFTKSGRRILHGETWKIFMKILGANPDRGHTMDTSKFAKRHPRNHVWACSCMEHNVTKRKHNSMTKVLGSTYSCHFCKTPVEFKYIK